MDTAPPLSPPPRVAPARLTPAQKRAQTQRLLAAGARDAHAEIETDAALARDLRFGSVDNARPVDAVLLTGATGFLGAHVLDALATRRPDLRIICPVRADTDDAACQRLARAAASYGIPLPPGRVHAFAHDLRHPLSAAPALQAAAAETQAIVHCAAQVRFTDGYAQARGANVVATRALLSLAAQGRRLHHVSTIAVFASGAYDSIDEATLPRVASFASAHGYAQSKLAAELMLHEARARGLSLTLYRPGLVGWHSGTGAPNAADFLTRFLTGSAQVGALPDIPIGLSIAPVDNVAAAIATTVLAPLAAPPVLHLLGEAPLAMGDLSQTMTEAGHPVALVPYADWIARIDADQGSPLHALGLLLPDQFDPIPARRGPSLLDALALDRGTGPSDALTRAYLAGAGIPPARNGALNTTTFLRKALP